MNKNDPVNKARQDEAFVDSLDFGNATHLDWAVTALFYAGLHYVEAFFATRKIHSADHRTRDSAIRRDLSIKNIYNDYSELKNHSINARYYCVPLKPQDVENLRPHLAAIKKEIAPYLAVNP